MKKVARIILSVCIVLSLFNGQAKAGEWSMDIDWSGIHWSTDFDWPGIHWTSDWDWSDNWDWDWSGNFDWLDDFSNCSAGSGNIIIESRAVSPFSAIEVRGNANVYVTQGPENEVLVEADDTIIDLITVRVEGDLLVIDSAENRCRRDTSKNIHVTMPNIQRLVVSGAGNIRTVAPIQTGSLYCLLSGVGTIEVSGEVAQQNLKLSGVGTIRNFGLTSENCTAVNSGVGDIELTATSRLTADVSGIGIE